nr:hypothetical protein [Streptomyces hygroscopicus]
MEWHLDECGHTEFERREPTERRENIRETTLEGKAQQAFQRDLTALAQWVERQGGRACCAQLGMKPASVQRVSL